MSDELRYFLAAWGCFAAVGGIVVYAWHTRFVGDDPDEPREPAPHRGVVTPPRSDSVEQELQAMLSQYEAR